MPRGGRRANSGRKKGSRAATKTREVVDEAIVRGVRLPLEYMLAIVGDESAPQARRDQMAIQAAPYCHPRLAAVSTSTVNGRDGGGDINITQIFAVPRGSRIDKSGAVMTIDGETTELASVSPYEGTPALSDQREMPAPVRFEVQELDPPQNVTRLDTFKNRRDDDDPGAA